MRFTTLILVLAAASPAAAQSVALNEDFSGSFPPTGWIQVKLGPSSSGWVGNGRAWHEDFPGGTTENYLVAPPLDLTTYSQVFLHFEGETNYATYRANHPNSIGDGISNVEVTTDGGNTWTVVWTDTSLNSMEPYAPSLDLSAFAGQNNVQVAFYFYGTFAQEWWVDNVIVDDQPVPVLTSMINPNNGHPYFLLGQADFATAKAKAIQLGGSLVSIDSASENSWLLSTFGNFGGVQRNLMVGLNDVDLEGTFVWDSGEALTYTNWASGEPNNGAGGEDFVQIVSGGLWNDFNGEGAHGLVEISQPTIRATPLVASQLGTITVSGMRVGAEIVLVFSTNGNGPFSSPFGVMEVDPDMVTPAFPAINGGFNFSTYIPIGLAGATLWGQGVQFNPDGSNELTSPFEAPIQ
ncbi:MAG: lectin-like protein [Planctomycetota bacterium]|nr:lectin-like protein [Planctomycetota bacterium]MDA1114718.1 lectin-like protein [Planctomycetota bacterium]